ALQNNTGEIDLLVTAPASTDLVWTGSASTIWDTTGANWTGTATQFTNYVSNVSFGNTSAVTSVTVAAGGVLPQSMTVNNDTSHNYLFRGGAITSSGGFTKLGNGTVTFANDASFSGGATVSG